jgi:hypothetical protein
MVAEKSEMKASVKTYSSMYHSKENTLVVLPCMSLAYFSTDKSIGFNIRINPSQVEYKVPVRSLDLVLDHFYQSQEQDQRQHRFAIYKKKQNLYMFIMFDTKGQIILNCPAHTHHWQQCMQSTIQIQRLLKAKSNKIQFKKCLMAYRKFSDRFQCLFPKEIIRLIGFHLFTKALLIQ